MRLYSVLGQNTPLISFADRLNYGQPETIILPGTHDAPRKANQS